MMHHEDFSSPRGRGRGRGGRRPQPDFGGFPFGGGPAAACAAAPGPDAATSAPPCWPSSPRSPSTATNSCNSSPSAPTASGAPAPGSVYPTLQQLEDEGLVTAVEAGGRKVFQLTDAGRAEAEARTGPTPWDEVVRRLRAGRPRRAAAGLRRAPGDGGGLPRSARRRAEDPRRRAAGAVPGAGRRHAARGLSAAGPAWLGG